MKVSVVATVCNEEASIAALLSSLLSQTKMPDEIVIVDGGSIDQTTQIIHSFASKNRIIKLFSQQGTIAQGRNFSIKKAKNKIIAQIDGGCIAKKNWLKTLTKHFTKDDVQVVAGYYEMTGDTPLQKAAAPFLGVPKQRFDPRTFLPSARSMAFRKQVWEKVGGYSEKLDKAGEDTLFNYAVIKEGIPIYREPAAVVYWEVPNNFGEVVKKIYSYAKGDAQTSIWWHPAQKLSTHTIKISTIFARYFIGLILLLMSVFSQALLFSLIVGFIFYLFWACWKLEDVLSDMRAKAWVPVLRIASDLAIIAGFTAGTIKR